MPSYRKSVAGLLLAGISIVFPRQGAKSAPANESASPHPRPLVPRGELEGYKLAWSDEFDGDKLDTEKWNYRTGERLWSQQLPENVSVHDGMLRIALKKEHVKGKEYTAGGVISKKTFKFGYYESRFKVPPGAGWHTSFWTAWNGGEPRPSGARQEIDICEEDSVNQTFYTTNVHQWAPAHKGLGATKIKTPHLSSDFHVWGCLFKAGECRFFFDGAEVSHKDVSKLQLDATNIWLTSLAANLGGTKQVDDARLPAVAEFDYVRFYEKP